MKLSGSGFICSVSVIWVEEIRWAMRNLSHISLYHCNFQSNSSPLQVESVTSSTNLPRTILFSVYHQTRCQTYTLCGYVWKSYQICPLWGSNCGLHEYKTPQN